jgi:hypothetical protein
MLTIWKYTLPFQNEVILQVPKQGNILTVQMQGDELVMWVVVDPKREPEERTILIRGTGHHIKDTVCPHYIGTVQVSGLVWHVFDSWD